MIKKLRYIVPLLLLLLVLLLSGCSDKKKLGGKVTFSDGEPLKAGTVFFSKDDFLARAHLRPDGTYDVGSLSQKDGLPPGTYKVYISGAVEAVDPNDPDKLRSLIAPEFASLEKTPLSVTVPGEKVYDIVVKKPEDSAK